jgi:hypothetical protein
VAVYYLVPCRCGQKIPVEKAQAGEILRCACGKKVEIPTLMGLKSLQRTADAPAVRSTQSPASAKSARADRSRRISQPASRSGWGAWERVAFLGALVTVVALIAVGFILRRWPIAPYSDIDPHLIRDSVLRASPADTWTLWFDLQAIGLSEVHPRVQAGYAMAIEQSRFDLRIAIICLAAGLVIAVSALVIGRLRRKRSPPPAKAGSRARKR